MLERCLNRLKQRLKMKKVKTDLRFQTNKKQRTRKKTRKTKPETDFNPDLQDLSYKYALTSIQTNFTIFTNFTNSRLFQAIFH